MPVHELILTKGDIMGRAIDMEKDIAQMKLQVERLQNQVRGMVSRLDEVDDILSDFEEVEEELLEEKVEEDWGSEITGDYRDEEETNVEGSDEGDGELDKRSSAVKSKTNK